MLILNDCHFCFSRAEMPTGDAAVLALCDEVWKWRLEQSPELATFCGFHQYDDRWDDISEETFLKKKVD